MATTSGATSLYQYGGFTLNTASSGLSVFNINAASANNFTLTAKSPGAVVLINVAGTAASFQNMGFSFSGIDAAHVLFNFQDATSLTLGGIGFLGSILAPKADVTFNNGNMTGTMIAKSVLGGGEFHLATFQGNLLDPPKTIIKAAAPEPSSWMTMIIGFGVTGIAIRHSRRKAVLA
jgi:choice-of-anchor A domain-containing protein